MKEWRLCRHCRSTSNRSFWCWCRLGAALKADKRFPSANIPYTLAVAGMALAALYGAATARLDGWQSVVMAVFTAIVQGGLCALASVGVHQMYKQAKTQKDGQ